MPATTRILALMAGCLAPALALADEDAPAPPRYRLEVGQEIVYRTTMTSQVRGRPGGRPLWTRRTAWVVGRPDDRTWDLILGQEYKVPKSPPPPADGGGPPPAPEAPDDADWTPHLVGRVRLTDDGRIATPDLDWPEFMDPRHLFPRLPADAAGTSWGSDRDAQASWYYYEKLPGPQPADGLLTFRALRNDPLLDVRLKTTAARYHFDPARGLLATFDFVSKHTDLKVEAVTTGRLESVNRRDAEWLGGLGREVDAYLAAAAAYASAAWHAGHDPDGPAARLAEAKAGLDRARASLTMPFLVGLIDGDLRAHPDLEARLAARAGRLAEILGKPAKDWDAADVDGRPRTLADDLGKVVLVPFWDAADSSSLEHLGRAIRIRKQFPRAPVAVVGVSTEWDRAAIPKVIQAYRFDGPTLLAGQEIPASFGLDRGSGLVVLDRRGAVRAVLDAAFISAALRDPDGLVAATVRDLLAEEAPD